MIHKLQSDVWAYYRDGGRTMPWRSNTDPYWILVSEIMLQQTRVSRIMPKFEEFIETFPSIQVLAKAPFQEVLKCWSGLGYNRRAKFLHQSAQAIVDTYGGVVPKNRKQLVLLPGIGPNTAGAILVYAYNQPEVFIETNIRSVFMHYFFTNTMGVDDRELLPIIKKAMPHENPREWYWALMDYGTYLKSTLPNPSRASKQHTRQSQFEGSDRQIRGQILKLIVDGPVSLDFMKKSIDDPRFERIIDGLEKENMVHMTDDIVSVM